MGEALIDRGSIPHRLGVGIGCVLGSGIIALFLLAVMVMVLDFMGVLV